MRSNKVPLILGIAAISGLLINSASAKAATVVAEGQIWDVQAVYTSFDESESLLESQPWYGFSTKATRFASRLGNALGIGQPGVGGGNPNFGPFFAYANDTISPGVSVQRYKFAGPGANTTIRATGLSSSTKYYYAVATAVPEPLTILGSTTALALGLGLKRKLVQKKN